MSASSIKAVTLDVGGTLIEPYPSVGELYASVAREHGITAQPAALTRRFSTAWAAKRDFAYSKEAWAKLVFDTFSFSDPGETQTKLFEELYQRFAEPRSWRLYEDVLPVLDELQSRDIKVGVLSNWDERLRPLLESLKLSRYFDYIFISAEIGFHKPSPVIFEEAVRKMRLPAAAILHVGDSHYEDVEGARGAGLQAALINRQKPGQDGHIGSLTEILDLI